jgi:hypothetical protein
MATTTTNFGWDIPQSTDLVKDGATAIAALGQDIDTALVDLKGGTTGQVLAKATNTDLDFSWVAQDDSNAIQNAIMDAKGDLIGATAADTPARLAVGTNGQVLTADSTAATGLKWATSSTGGMTLLSTTSLSGASTTVSSIDQTYINLFIAITGMTSTANFAPGLQYNGVTTGYKRGVVADFNADVQFANTNYLDIAIANALTAANTSQNFFYNIPNYANTGFHNVLYNGTYFTDTSVIRSISGTGANTNTSAVTSITFEAGGGSFNGGTIKIYGVK